MDQKNTKLEQELQNSVRINPKSEQGSIDTTTYPIIKFNPIQHDN